jgi:hypothetical protein
LTSERELYFWDYEVTKVIFKSIDHPSLKPLNQSERTRLARSAKAPDEPKEGRKERRKEG